MAGLYQMETGVSYGWRPFPEVDRLMAAKIEAVDDLYVHDLQDIYSAQEQLGWALTKMAVAADSLVLRAGLARHLEQTRQHLRRMHQALRDINQAPDGRESRGMRALIDEVEKIMSTTSFGAALDSALIEAARKIKQFDIVAYRAAIARAYELGLKDVASLLEWNLQEDELTDYRLRQLAEELQPPGGPVS
ncbi:MAG: DUF892 family protein [Candidatus Promineofilum sp.]|nr:DUF892 family protein [Promineifilum sp.]